MRLEDDLERVRARRVREDVVGLLVSSSAKRWVANGVGSSRPSAISCSSFGVVSVSTSPVVISTSRIQSRSRWSVAGMAVHADVREPAARADQLRAELERLGNADRLDRDVGAETVRQLHGRAARASSRPLLTITSAPNSSAFSSRASARSIATILPGV